MGLALAAGCQHSSPAERFGKTFYLDGAGNWGFGASEVPRGLQAAGYQGDVELFIWTTSFSPLIDQLNVPAARLRARALAQRIEDYHQRYPENQINVIALSAGTGVATWAIENLKTAEVDNLVLLGSSLSHNYDMSQALRHLAGEVYVYYSPHDQVLKTVEFVGTIDGVRGVHSAGQVGLRPPRGGEERIVNVGWNRDWMRLGWAGAHTDCTNERFVRYEVAKRLGPGRAGAKPWSAPVAEGDPAVQTAAAEGN